MKRQMIITVTLVLSLTGTLLAQQLNYSDLSGNVKPKGAFTSYVSENGATYQIGDKIKIGTPSSNKTFTFITEGDGILIPVTGLKAKSSGQETEIKKFYVLGSKRTGFYVSLKTKGATGLTNYSIQLENAIDAKEVASFGMSSDEALAALKKAKDKLELDLISPANYDSIKAELVKYIH